MSDLKNVSVEEIQMTAQTENTVGIVELSDSDLEGILGGAQYACGGKRCEVSADVGDIVNIRVE